jgi:peptidoglycan-associated lipoprotein
MKSSLIRSLLLAASVAGVMFLAGCAKKAVESPPTPATPPPAPTETPTPAPTPAPPVTTPTPPAPAPVVNPPDLKPAFFDYDSDVLRDDARVALDGDAKVLRDHPGLKLVVEGHCDERGTVEYNQALGERRANAARDYLVQAGIETGRLRVISYGKERPFSDGHDESAWSQNRRANFISQ